MEGMGYTEHGFRHANLVASISYQVLHRLGYDGARGEPRLRRRLPARRRQHAHRGRRTAQTGALLVYQALKDRMPPATTWPRSWRRSRTTRRTTGTRSRPISAAVILADKSDVHRSRVRRSGQIDFDIHDRVNSAVEQSFLRVDSEARTVTLELTIDTGISQVMEYFEIFLGRMQMCRHAAETAGLRDSGSRSTGPSSHEGNPLVVGLHRHGPAVLVVASLIGFATGALKPPLGPGSGGRRLGDPAGAGGHAGPGDATGAREHPQPRRRVRRRRSRRSSSPGTTIEVQLPGLAKGSIQQRAKTQSA